MTDSESSTRKQREHPYTKQLNRIKSKICYYKKRLNDETDDKKKDSINDYINNLEYERFILKLNPHDITVIKKFCTFNKLSLDVEQIVNDYIGNLSD